MNDTFAHYLLSKQSVDERALNRGVLECLKAQIKGEHIDIVEAGAGIGTMLVRLLRWGILPDSTDYTLVEVMPENIRFAQDWLPEWAGLNGFQAESQPEGELCLGGPAGKVQVHFVQADVLDYTHSRPKKADLLIAHAFLDLLPLPGSLPGLFSLLKPGGLGWLTINFDGMTTFEPSIDPELDERIERLFHKSMDERITNEVRSGDSRTGRHLFGYLHDLEIGLLAVGPSDWVVSPLEGRYPADEQAFLEFILGFFESALAGCPELDPDELADWLTTRRRQVQSAELVYIAHQLDFLVRK